MKLSGLSSLFNFAVMGLAGVAVALSLTSTGPDGPEAPPVTAKPKESLTCTISEADATNPGFILKRGLTDNERAFYARFFGSKIDTDGVCISVYQHAPGGALTSDVPEGETKNIHIYGLENYSEDYTQERYASTFGALAYEMTHLMQHQQGTHENEPDVSVSSEYETLYGRRSLDKYTDAQQRGIISDYVRFIFHPSGDTAHLKNFQKDACEAQDMFIDTVEIAFPAALKMRHEHQNRNMTDNEKAFVYSVFGDQIDLVDQMTIRERAKCFENAAGTVFNGSKTDFHAWGQKYHEDDYTKGGLFNFGLFIHEVTHLWQHQQNSSQTGGDDREYDYPIDTDKWNFRDYHTEQQGAILEDYVRYFLHPYKDTRRLTETRNNLDGLKKIVEEQFPAARITREYFELHGKLPDLPTVKSWNAPVASRAAPAIQAPG